MSFNRTAEWGAVLADAIEAGLQHRRGAQAQTLKEWVAILRVELPTPVLRPIGRLSGHSYAIVVKAFVILRDRERAEIVSWNGPAAQRIARLI